MNPIDLRKWADENIALLKPPIANKLLFKGDSFFVMMVGGSSGNARTDFHVNATEELFYQLKGSLSLLLREEGKVKEVRVGEGEMYLLRGGVPHSPRRPPHSLGLVVERTRTEEMPPDQLLWFCSDCDCLIHSATLFCTDIETQLTSLLLQYSSSQELRTCKKCGKIN